MQYVRQFFSPQAFAAAACLALCLAAPTAAAQNGDDNMPAYRDYKGVHIGMAAEEARAKLGNPTDKGDAQDFYNVSDKQTVQVYYGADKKVTAVVVTYLDAAAGAPALKSIFGTDAEAKPDGSVHRMERYPKAGFWLSYSRTAGNSPLVVVTLSKIQ
jgi:outer membrane protein assembly factor BamE (lipoprotein component of BamABCDE complex)